MEFDELTWSTRPPSAPARLSSWAQRRISRGTGHASWRGLVTPG